MVKLKIGGMTCNHCVQAIQNALSQLEGVVIDEISLERGEAILEGNASAEALICAVEEVGFSAEVIST